MNKLEVELKDLQPGVCLLKLTGEVDAIAYNQLVEFTERNVGPEINAIVVDLEDLVFMDSSGLRFVQRLKRLYGWENIAIYGMSPNIRRIFAIVSIDREIVDLTEPPQLETWVRSKRKAA